MKTIAKRLQALINDLRQMTTINKQREMNTFEKEIRGILDSDRPREWKREAFRGLGYYIANNGWEENDLFLDAANKVLVKTDMETTHLVFDNFKDGVEDFRNDIADMKVLLKRLLEKESKSRPIFS